MKLLYPASLFYHSSHENFILVHRMIPRRYTSKKFPWSYVIELGAPLSQ